MEPVLADVRDCDSLVRAMRGATAVINLVTQIHERSPGELENSIYAGMRNIVDAARAARLSRIIHVGAIGEHLAHGNHARRYLYWKKLASEWLVSTDLDYTIFDTSIVFGPGDQHLTAIALALKWIRCAPIPRAGAGENRLQPVWVADLVGCLLKALRNPLAARKRFSLAGPDVLRYRELVELVARELGQKPRIILVPDCFVRIVLSAGARSLTRPPVTTALLDLWDVDSVADSSATYEFFGIEPVHADQSCHYLRDVGAREFNAWRLGLAMHGVFASCSKIDAASPSGRRGA
jgi:NADH dehydrogenase